MEPGSELPVQFRRPAGESPEESRPDDRAGQEFPPHGVQVQPSFVEVFQQIINSLSEQIALVDDRWTILAVNEAWTKTAAVYGYDELSPGTNYLEFCEARAREGHKPAKLASDGIRMMDGTGERSFRYLYHGKDRWDGRSFQLCVNRVEVGGGTFATVTRYDVTELVELRHLREGFSHSLIEGQDLERRRIAREVHDSTMQSLAGLGLSIGALKRSRGIGAMDEIVEEMEQLLSEAQSELRAISFLAHPPQLSDVGMANALRQLADGFGRRTGLRITVSGAESLDVLPAAQVAIYRMVQEALSNVHRHARATDVAVGLFQRATSLHLVIADNGSGMPAHIHQGVGLASMKERIGEIGGRLSIRRGNPGTMLIATIPVDADLRAVGDMALPAGPALSHLDRLDETVAKEMARAARLADARSGINPRKEWLPGPDSNRRPFD